MRLRVWRRRRKTNSSYDSLEMIHCGFVVMKENKCLHFQWGAGGGRERERERGMVLKISVYTFIFVFLEKKEKSLKLLAYGALS